MNLTFTNPQYLWFLIAIPLLIIIHLLTMKFKKTRALKFANFEALSRAAPEYLFGSPYIGLLRSNQLLILIVRALVLICIIFAVSGAVLTYQGTSSEFDYVLAIDTSASMAIDDFAPNRLEAAKQASIRFIDSLEGQVEIGIVTFSGVNVVDHRPSEDLPFARMVMSNLTLSRIGGTDIGGAIITASNLLEMGEKQKSIILITDGQSNIGTPLEDGIAYASHHNIIVNTIGLASEEGGSFGELKDIQLTLDEESLKQIAELTGGSYIKAETKEQFEQDFLALAQVHKRTIKEDMTLIFMFFALFLLFLEWAVVNVKYRTVP